MVEIITHGLLTFSMLMLLSKDRKPEDTLIKDIIKTINYFTGSKIRV